MIQQYPYKLFVLKIEGETFDENGFATTESITQHYDFHCYCRDTLAKSGDVVRAESGEFVQYHSNIVLPMDTEKIAVGSFIKIEDVSGNIRLQGKVVHFVKNQLHCRVFI